MSSSSVLSNHLYKFILTNKFSLKKQPNLIDANYIWLFVLKINYGNQSRRG